MSFEDRVAPDVRVLLVFETKARFLLSNRTPTQSDNERDGSIWSVQKEGEYWGATDGEVWSLPNPENGGGDVYIRSNGFWVRLGGATEVLVVPTLAQARITGHTGYHPAILVQTHGGGVDGLTPRYNDGGSRIVFYDPTDTTSPDNGGTIIRTSADGSPGSTEDRCYKTNNSVGVPITWFGAIADCRTVVDAATTATSADVTSATAAWQVGDGVLVTGAAFNPLSGTATTVSGSAVVVGAGSLYEDQIWINSQVTFAGQAGTFTVTEEMTGTAEYKATDALLIGTGTKFISELYIGAMVRFRAGAVVASTQIGDVFFRQIIAITDDTHATMNAVGMAHAIGAKMTWMRFGDPHVVFTGTPTGTFLQREVVDQAGTGAAGVVDFLSPTKLSVMSLTGNLLFDGIGALTGRSSGATFAVSSFVGMAVQCRLLVKPAPAFSASGLTLRGPPKRLAATVLSVAGTTATLSAAADLTVTNALTFMGTDASPAVTAALAASDHVLVPSAPEGVQSFANSRFNVGPGAFLCLTGVEIPKTHTGVEFRWGPGARLVVGEPFRVNAAATSLFGPIQGYPLGGGGGFDFNELPQITYVGPPSEAIVMFSDGTNTTSAGSGIQGVRVEQMIDYTLDNNDTSFGGTGGVTGFAFGSRDFPGVAINGFTAKRLVVLACEHGFMVYGGTQAYVIEDIWAARYNNGWYPRYTVTGVRTGTFLAGELVTQATSAAVGIAVSSTATTLILDNSSGQFDPTHTYTGGTSGATFAPTAVDYLTGPYSHGFGVGVGVGVRYPNSAACTNGKIQGQGLIQGFRTGCQFSNPFGGQVATTDWGGTISIQNTHPINAAYFRVYGCGRVEISGAHCENGPTVDDFSHIGIELGAPSISGAVQSFTAHTNFISGPNQCFSAYNWDGFDIRDNWCDSQATYAQNAFYLSKVFADVSGGTGVRQHGNWGLQLKPAGGGFSHPLEIWPYGGPGTLAISGFDRYHVFNIDSLAGITRPEQFVKEKSRLDEVVSPNLSSNKKIVNETRLYENVYVGDANNSFSTIVGANSTAGTFILHVATTSGFFVNALVDVNQGGPRDEFVRIRRIIDATDLELTTALLYTHTAVQADVVTFGVSFLWGRGSLLWELPPGGGSATFWADNGGLTMLPEFPATAGAQSHVTLHSFYGNYWDGTASVTYGAGILSEFTHTGDLNPLATQYHFFFNIKTWEVDQAGQFYLGSKLSGIAELYGTGNPNGVRTATPASIYFRQDDGTIWDKLTGTGNTGWVQLAAGSFVPLSATVQATTPILIAGDNAVHDLSVPRVWSLTLGAEGQVLTTISGVATWATPAGGFVPTTRTLEGMAPILVGGVHTPVDLSANRQIAIEIATTSAHGSIALQTDLGGTGTNPTVLAATGAGGVFLVRCATQTFAAGGTIQNTSGNMVLTAAAGNLLLSSVGTSTLNAVGAVSVTSGGSSDLTLTGAGDLIATAAGDLLLSGVSSSTLNSAGAVTIASGGSADLTATAAGDLIATCSGDLLLSGVGSATLNSAGAVSIASGTASNVTITSQADAVIEAGSSAAVILTVGTGQVALTTGTFGKLSLVNHETVTPVDISSGFRIRVNGTDWVIPLYTDA